MKIGWTRTQKKSKTCQKYENVVKYRGNVIEA